MTSIVIAPEVRLKRYLYFSSEESRYISSSKNFDTCQLSKIPSLFELITADKETLILDLIDSVKTDPLLSKRESLIFLLAALTRNAKTKEIKTAAYNKVSEICKTTEELFLFIKFAHCLNKNFSHGLRRIIRDYYLNKEPLELLHVVTQCRSYQGWSHRDIFKLIHIKTEKNPAQGIIVFFIIKPDLVEVKELIDRMEPKNAAQIQEIYGKLENFYKLKHCRSEFDAVDLITVNNYKIQQIPTELLKFQIVWESLIPSLEIPELLPELVRLNRLGFLKSNNPNSALNKVVEILSDTKKCVASRIQPAHALIYLKTFERGKPVDPQKKAHVIGLTKTNSDESNTESKKKDPVYFNPPKNNAIISALYKLLQHSFKNVQPTRRRFLITLDCREQFMKRLCFINKAVTCLEAAVVLTFSLLRAEKEVFVAVFDGANIKPVQLDKNMTYAQALQKLKETEGGPVVLHNTINWATGNKKSIDVFLNFIFSADTLHRAPKELKNSENIITTLKKYRQKVHLPNTKMINVSLGGKKLQIADGSPHILDICGFDHHVPKMIEACCKGILH